MTNTDKIAAIMSKLNDMIAEWEEIRDDSSKSMQTYSEYATFEGRYCTYENAKKVLEGLNKLKALTEEEK